MQIYEYNFNLYPIDSTNKKLPSPYDRKMRGV